MSIFELRRVKLLEDEQIYTIVIAFSQGVC